MTVSTDLILRRARPQDEPGILALLATSLGWDDDERHAGLYRWKHRDNPFGASPAWVAEDGGEIVGLRTFMRWRFRRGDETVPAVRAVDTATHPDHRGRGIFTRLTTMAIEELREEGVAFVFNTPNDQSLPGYLKMGWEVVGRVPVSVRPSGPGSLLRMWRARVPADLWSMSRDVGLPAARVLDDDEVLGALLEPAAASAGSLRTDRTREYLRWRYGFEPLAYRAASVGGPAAGVAFFRLRRRGPAVEAVVGDVLARGEPPGAFAAAVRAVAREAGADHVVAATRSGSMRAGLLPLPRQGPILTWRALAEDERPDIRAWRLSLGDVELL